MAFEIISPPYLEMSDSDSIMSELEDISIFLSYALAESNFGLNENARSGACLIMGSLARSLNRLRSVATEEATKKQAKAFAEGLLEGRQGRPVVMDAELPAPTTDLTEPAPPVKRQKRAG